MSEYLSENQLRSFLPPLRPDLRDKSRRIESECRFFTDVTVMVKSGTRLYDEYDDKMGYDVMLYNMMLYYIMLYYII